LSLIFTLTVAAQDTPKIELFGGYSRLWLTGQPRSDWEPASNGWNNGWDVSAKLNVTPRIGLLADFSGHYGHWTLTPYTRWPGTDHERRIEPMPGDMRQRTFLFGPEVRLLRRDRLTVNVRALMGVAHTNTAVLPLREPVQWPTDLFGPLPPLTELTFPSASKFAASFGGSLDYRITDRLSFRIIQPELLLIRSGGRGSEPWNQSNLKLSSGIVFTSGQSSGKSSGPQFSFGVIGGAALTDAFGHERTGFFIGPSGGLVPTLSRSYSTLKDYVIGPMVDVGLPWRGLSVEVDALYRPMNLTMAGVRPDGSLTGTSPATVVTWQFPALVKYRFTSSTAKPFIEAGPSFRSSGNLNDASPSAYGGTAGLGIEAQLGKLRIGPVVRYTHWAADDEYEGSRTKRNQVELLIGLCF